MKWISLVLTLWAVVFSRLGAAQDHHSPIIFIYDASGSMWGQIDGKTKMEIASTVLSEAIGKLPDEQALGLVAYGHRNKTDCRDVEFIVNASENTKAQSLEALKSIQPLGKTPLAYSAELVIDRLRQNKEKATIILITDGIESCDGDICEVVGLAKEEGIDFRMHIIGFGLKGAETEQLICAAKKGDGQYYDAEDANKLGEVLYEATQVTVDEPDGNFTVFAVRNGEPIDALARAYKAGSRELISSARTYRDTAKLYLPSGKYDLHVAPLEDSDIKLIVLGGVESVSDKIHHETVSFDGAKLLISTMNNEAGWDTMVKIYPSGSNQTVATGRTYGREDTYEVNPGTYDIELTALVIKGSKIVHKMEGIALKAGETKNIAHAFESGEAKIGVVTGNELVDAVVKISDTATKEVIASGRTYTSANNNPKSFILTPGTYEVSIMTLGKHKGHSESFTIVVKAGETVENVHRY
ncbi:hypothetical protein GCM10028791_17510 [Echinicola sediminis]